MLDSLNEPFTMNVCFKTYLQGKNSQYLSINFNVPSPRIT